MTQLNNRPPFFIKELNHQLFFAGNENKDMI